MSNSYIGEIRMFGGSFAPAGWALCQGQLMPISENDTLFNLIGTTYGGDGQTTFALPDLQGRVPMHPGGGSTIGEKAGTENVTLTTQQIPAHNHLVVTSSAPSSNTPSSSLQLSDEGGAGAAQVSTYFTGTPLATTNLHPSTIGFMGGSQPHSNLQPYVALTFIISLFGIYPSAT